MRNYKKILSAVLALALTLSGISVPTEVQAAETNLALNKSVTASAEYSTMPASNLTDADTTSRWSAENTAPQWAYVDLGESKTMDKFSMIWESDSNYASSYNIYVSDNTENWGTAVVSRTDNATATSTETLEAPVSGQYVKLEVTGTAGYPNVSCSDFSIELTSDGESSNGGTTDTTVTTPDVNHVRSATMSASTLENASLSADKANDGAVGKSSRWASDYSGNGNQWLKVTFADLTQIEHIKITLFTRDMTPTPSNVSHFSIKYTDAANETRYAEQNYANKESGNGYTTDISIVLDEPIVAKDITLCEFVTAEGLYNNVSIEELEAYSNEQIAAVDPVNDITVTTPGADDTELTVNIPEVAGYEITYNGTDYEQVVDADRNIHQPIVDTTVNVSFKIVETATGDYEFKEIPVTVPGTYTQDEGDNEAPEIIPELREWKGHTGVFTVSENAKVVIADDKLKETADVFAVDYADLTGKTMTVVEGTEADAGNGDFYFAALAEEPSEIMEEMYLMTIGDKVTVEAETATGAFWATRTILQALKSGDNTIPKGITRDYPLYSVRGIILDVGRKTFKLDYLEQMVKQLSWYKMNDFQIHLNDNLIPLENYSAKGEDPMQAYSGFRLESKIKKDETVDLDNGKGGVTTLTYQANLTSTDVFYTKEEFKNFIKESDVYGVNIVPEIDTPAHSLALTKVLPELRTGTYGRENDHLNLTTKYAESLDFVTNIFDEYMLGTDPVFTKDTVVHIGCDEYTANPNAFRQFCNDMAAYVKDTGRTPRIWGSLTSIKGDGSVEVPGDGIEMNLWNFSWARIDEMYESGFDLINCNDGHYYIVPNAGYYYDYLNESIMYNLAINSIGGITIPAGDPQMIGGSYAVWNDMTDYLENGISEYDIYERLTEHMGLFAAKLWGKGDMTLEEAQAVSAVMGDAPNTNFGYEAEADENGKIAQYTAEDMKALEGKNASVETVDYKEALKLNGGESYVATGMETVGLGNDLRVKVKRTSNSTEDQILFESPYGSIKAVQGTTGKVGITRENRDYSFNYELPLNTWVELEFKNTYEVVSLYVNGVLADTIGDGEQVEGQPLKATCMLPVAKIGSETNAFEGYVTDVRISTNDDYASTAAMELAALVAQEYLAEGNTNAELSALIEDAAELSAQFAPSAEAAAKVRADIEEILEDAEYERADYSRVNEYLKLASTTDLSKFTEETAEYLDAAVSRNVDYLPVSMQDTVDAYEDVLREALNGLVVPEPAGEYYDNSKATVNASSYQSGSGNPEYAIDGDEGTMWHSNWDITDMPHWIEIKMDSVQEIEGLYYLPRSGGGNGTIKKYTVMVSATGNEADYQPVASGEWTINGEAKEVKFDAQNAKAVRLIAEEASNNNGSAVEIKIRLVPKAGDTTELNALVDIVDTLVEANKDNNKFSKETWAELTKALDEAKAVAGMSAPTKVQVDNAMAALLTAKSDLALKEAEQPINPENPDPEVPEKDEVVRLYGADRYATGYKVADAYKEELGVDKFDAVIVATGKNFADALSGSYLAAVKNAPILLTNGKEDNVAALHDYIKANVKAKGTVYILGGTAAVPEAVESIEDAGYIVERLYGASRYDTNLAILAEAGIEGDDLIVATGKNFADSLSASAVKKPILLVKPTAALTEAQKAIVKDRKTIYIIGGEGAVSAGVEAELDACGGTVERVYGNTRYETSIAVANRFFEGEVDEAIVANGKKFPDGLCGGPLAAAMNAPLILTADKNTDAAEAYVAGKAIKSGYVLGGTGALADNSVVAVFGLESAAEIIVPEAK